MPTAAQIAQGARAALSAGLLMKVQTNAPLFSSFDVRTSRSTRVLSLALVALPTPSRFVREGQGVNGSEGQFQLVEFNMAKLKGQLRQEKDSAARWDAEHVEIGSSWWDLQAMAKMKADALNIEKQIVNGTGNEALGFPGMRQITPFRAGNTFVSTDDVQAQEFKRSVLDAGGTTANKGSSAYSIVFGPMDCQLVWGNFKGGELFGLSDPIEQYLAPDPINAPSELALYDVADITAYIGLSVAGYNPQNAGETVPTQYSLRRATNITAQAGHKCDDALIDKLTRSHGVGIMPDMLVMSQRSGEQLAASRAPSAVNFNMGAGDAQTQTFGIYPAPPEFWTMRGKKIQIVYPACVGSEDAIEA